MGISVACYDNFWKKKLSKLAALPEAQLWMLREGPKQIGPLRSLDIAPVMPKNDHGLPPYYLAAFVLSGDWR